MDEAQDLRGEQLPDAPRGVRGWLLLLCVMMAIVMPTGSGIAIYGLVTTGLLSRLEGNPLRTFLLIYAFFLGISAAFMTYAGIRLWGKYRGAPALAQYALLSPPLVLLTAIVLPYLVGIPSVAATKLAGMAAMHFAKGIPATILWYVYLGRSRRVRATFSV